MEQDVYYEIGKAPDWTSDIALCMTQSIGETGLIPSGVPSSETIEGKEYIHLERDVMMLNISVPFAHIFEMLKDLSETPIADSAGLRSSDEKRNTAGYSAAGFV